MKKILTFTAAMLFAPLAFAGTCEVALGNAFTPNQEVALCRSFGSAITTSLLPTTTNTIDLGSSAKKWRSAYFGTSVGIGVNPAVPLHVNGDGSASGVSLFNNSASGDAGSGIRIDSRVATTHYNWMIGAQNNIGAGLEFTPSTAVGGTTFSTPSLSVTNAGNVSFAGTLSGTGTATLGWSIQSAANQACTTTCTTPCVFGQETTSKAILACSDATADSCLCAGAS